MFIQFFRLFLFPGFLIGSPNGPSFDLDTAKIIFFFGSTPSENQTYALDSIGSVLQHPKFIHNHTTLYMNGYNASAAGNDMQMMVDAFNKANSTNFLAVDWQPLSNGPFAGAEFNLLRVAPRLADSVLQMFDAGLNNDSFDLLGLGLGAHGAGLIAGHIIEKTGGDTILNRVTYLEPTNPEIHLRWILPPMTNEVAKFVQAIHTDAGGRGIARAVGHADFWPNGGIAVQPGCPSEEFDNSCSHLKAAAYYAQSVANVHPEQLIAYRALGYDDFLENEALFMNSTGTPMGVNCPPSARGDYFLQIDSDYAMRPEAGMI